MADRGFLSLSPPRWITLPRLPPLPGLGAPPQPLAGIGPPHRRRAARTIFGDSRALLEILDKTSLAHGARCATQLHHRPPTGPSAGYAPARSVKRFLGWIITPLFR